MNTYMMKSPIYYAIEIKGREAFLKNGTDSYYVLENEDEIDEFAKKFNMDWHWNMRKGILSFKDKSEGVKLKRPEYVQIGDAVVAYNDGETWRVDVWTSEEFERKFTKVDKQENENRKFRGRKLILHWGKKKIEILKLPYGNGQKDPIFDLFDSVVVLANVYEGPDGKLEDEVLGRPAGDLGDGTCIEGRQIQYYVTDDCYWMTPEEAQKIRIE